MSKLALLGGAKVRPDPLPLYNTIGEKEKAAVMEVLDSGVLSGFAAQPNSDHYGGKWIEALEGAYCEKFAVKHAIAVNSATTALHAAVAAMGVGPGDEVIVPPHTLSASATSVLFTGAVPVFADIEPDFFCLDPKSVEDNITPYTKGILAVNLYGQPAALFELRQIAKRHGLFLLEDNSQSPGALIQGKVTGTIGDAGVFSLNRHKVMQCGEGGVIVTNDDRIAEVCRLVRNHGEKLVSDLGVKDITNTVGMNYRMPNMEAAIAKIQLDKLDSLTEPRVTLANHLRSSLSGIDCIHPCEVRPDCTHVYYFFPMRFDRDLAGVSRELFVDAVKAEGFHLAGKYEKPIYLEPVYQQKLCFGKDGFPFSANPRNEQLSYARGICPVVERLQDFELMWTIITYPPLSTADMDLFVEACDKVLRNKDDLRNLAA